MKNQSLASEDWKVLIILDACRYDYFNKHYKKYLKGKLEKRISRGTWTLEWLVKNFTGKYPDIVYISGIPYINSRIKVSYHNLEFCAKEKFFRVIDAWDFGWSEELGAVLPTEINKLFLMAKKLYPKKRFILHYDQPHQPYIPLSMKDKDSRIGSLGIDTPNFKSFRYLLGRSLIKHLGEVNVWKFRRLIGMAPLTQQEYIIRNHDIDKLKKLYEENLLLVLKEVSKILPKIKGKVIITSDHGEMLGENGRIGHPDALSKPYKELVEVPYLKLGGVK